MSDKLYIVALVFILFSLVVGYKIQEYLSNRFSALTFNIGYAVIIGGLFSLVYFVALRNSKESFFFQVSKCNPKCSGAYYGKPATFQFTPLSPNGTSCKDQNCGYGMISECDHPECKGVLNKYGGANNLNSLQPSQP
jgi:hypothetical protein